MPSTAHTASLAQTEAWRITEIFQKLESTLSALIDKKSSLLAISMNAFYHGKILWSGHFEKQGVLTTWEKT